jgi:hypothetical protein
MTRPSMPRALCRILHNRLSATTAFQGSQDYSKTLTLLQAILSKR